MYTTLIDATTLAENIKNPNWVVFDCRFNLNEPDEAQEAYECVHIPGAYYLHLDHDLSSPITPETGRHPLPDANKLAATLANFGVNQDSQIVVYDDVGGMMAASRAWWLIRWLGHEKVAVLDGGMQAWKQGFEYDEPAPPQKGNFVANIQQQMVVETADIDLDKMTLLDARAKERFLGEIEPLDTIAGHIPSSLNRPLKDNLVKNRFKTPDVLRQEYLSILGDTPIENVVQTCGSGVTACHNHLAMMVAGLGDTRLYAGSWSEWIRDTNRPMVTPDNS